MADQQDRRRVGLEEILQPHHRLEVEVVGRLVEQQHVGRGEQQAGERDAHLPPAREAVERPALHLLVEAEPHQDARGARGRGVGVDRRQPLVDVAQPVGIGAGLALGQQRGALGIGGEHRVDGRGGAGGRLLREVAEAGAARHLGGARVGLEHARDHAHERRLARAVAPHQPHAAARRQRGARVVEDRAAAEAHGDVRQVEHARALSTGRAYAQPRRRAPGARAGSGGGW